MAFLDEDKRGRIYANLEEHALSENTDSPSVNLDDLDE